MSGHKKFPEFYEREERSKVHSNAWYEDHDYFDTPEEDRREVRKMAEETRIKCQYCGFESSDEDDFETTDPAVCLECAEKDADATK